ncbi:5'/3'-nucleotidase SurE [Roseiconus lacunae]|uniref:5'-nucleotidase n=1 Tax=Roseiconus lacunae TaxID=2605694 RepID=A0ABT7PLD5_9BACT|nr:5'/3'-nucleotidase SurE [Roseiconus lacunae]MCD0460785.1 5'/3'-nucleotidase SurE [Roseiconus lacunae]MDM4017138.1 5'/3'-nucleotidase SurE [Roseiconus lacunae]WRQ51282.1 5'/3'-nucleotidase SurE [Stieleria sp. HD01]
MKILLTNDDGVEAPGLQALSESLDHVLGLRDLRSRCEVRVVAPNRCRSECGHSLEAKRPLLVEQVRDGWHCVDGTPVDCVRVALQAMNYPADLVISGINAGANLGVNLLVSGTFAAAREASLQGVPAMAVSHYRRPGVPKEWAHTPQWLEQTIGDFLDTAILFERNHSLGLAPLWNVNLPATEMPGDQVPPRVHCAVDRKPLDRQGRIGEDGSVQFELDFHARPRESGRDVDHCFSGSITVSHVDPHFGLGD